MKKLAFLILALVYCLFALAGNNDSLRIDTNDSSYTAKKLTFKKTTAVLLLNNGEKLEIPIEDIKCYFKNGVFYKRLPLYENGKCKTQLEFMELVKNQGNLNLYKFYNWSYNPNVKVTVFLLYDDEELVMEYDESSHP
jgi:hypothetical protein